MAETTEVAGRAAAIPTREELDHVERFTREPFAADPDALRPGTARRRALDAALAEIEAGLEEPSIEWRQQYSLMLGLERQLAVDEPHLADGTVLSAHQVDVLSGTLTALIAEIERQNGNGAALQAYEDEDEEEADDDEEFEGVADDDEEFEDEDEDEDDEEDEPEAEDWPEPSGSNGVDELEDDQLPEQPEDPAAARRFCSSTRLAQARLSPRLASWRDPGPAAR
jgi:ribonuclease E